jgi:glycosyltransferase involved in cell wall biosynthesis
VNLLFMNSVGAESFGGGETWMIAAAAGLAARGHRVWVGGETRGLYTARARQEGLTVAPLWVSRDPAPWTSWKISQFLTAHAIDVMICGLNRDVRVAGLGARWARTPLVLARHGSRRSRRWRHRLTLRLFADGIITNTRAISETYAVYGWFPDGFVSVVHNGVRTAAAVEPFRFPVRQGTGPRVLAAGRLSPEKGFDYLVDAAAILRDRGRADIPIVIAGQGRLLEALSARVARLGLSTMVHFVGHHDDIWPLLLGCDIFVLPSLSEGMPNALMEAMAAGKPVVATNVGGVPELLDGPECGITVSPGHAAAIADAVLDLAASPDRRLSMGHAGRERVRKEFSMSAMIDNLERVLQDRLSRARRR